MSDLIRERNPQFCSRYVAARDAISVFFVGMGTRRLSAHRVFLTRRSEYHVRNHVCFGVRDRRTGTWLPEHWALGKPLATAFPQTFGNVYSFGAPVIGEALCFVIEDNAHYTSPVLAVEEREQLDIAAGFGRFNPNSPAGMAARGRGSIRETH